MTLIEIVVSILILSIAGTILLGGFSTVIRVFGKANEYKNASDMLMAFAENSEQPEQLSATNDTIEYTIISDKIDIAVKIDLCHAEIKTNDDVILRIMDTKAIGNVGSTEAYKNLEKNIIPNVQLQYDLRINALKKLGRWDEAYPYNDLMFKKQADVPNIEWETFLFPTTLLPKAMQSSLNNDEQYYLKFYYPWDYLLGQSAYHGGILYYLSINSGVPRENGEEIIHVVYDTNDQKWYYNPTNKYVLKYDAISRNPLFFIDGKDYIVTNINTFTEHVKNPSNGWYALNAAAEFNQSDPDSFWKEVE